MKIIDLYPDPKHGLFTEVFKDNFPTEYNAIFGEMDSVGLDTLVLLNYSEREVVNTITQANANEYIKNIIALSVNNWVRVASAYNAQYDVLNPVQQQTTREDNITENANNNNTNVASNKPYNATDFVEYDKDSTTYDNTRTNNVTSTQKVVGLGNKSVTDELKKEIEFNLQNWRKSIIFAIINDITKLIY
jgi:hypothetical protein